MPMMVTGWPSRMKDEPMTLGIGAVLLLPGAIAQHGHRRRGGLVVRGGDGAAHEWRPCRRLKSNCR